MLLIKLQLHLPRDLNNIGCMKYFWFLVYLRSRQQSLDNESMMVACVNLENALKGGDNKYIDAEELCVELIFTKDLFENSMVPLDIMYYLTNLTYYHVVEVACRIVLDSPCYRFVC